MSRRFGGVFVQERQPGGCITRERAEGGVRCAKFWKMVYEIIGRKSFSVFLQRLFRSTEVIFSLTSILQRNKHPQILKTFFEKYFIAKQTERKNTQCNYLKSMNTLA